jgi:hypothetical protein
VEVVLSGDGADRGLQAEEDALAKSHQDVGAAYYHREGDRSKRPGPALEQSKIWMSERLKAICECGHLHYWA